MKIWLVDELDDSSPYLIRYDTKAFDSYEKMYQYISNRLDELVPTEKEREELCAIWHDTPNWEAYKKDSIERNEDTELRWKEIEVR